MSCDIPSVNAFAADNEKAMTFYIRLELVP